MISHCHGQVSSIMVFIFHHRFVNQKKQRYVFNFVLSMDENNVHVLHSIPVRHSLAM